MKQIIIFILLFFTIFGFSAEVDELLLDSREVKVSSETANLNAAVAYIDIVFGEYISKPGLVSFPNGIQGFADPGEQAWETKFVSKKKGLQGLIWTHVKTGDILIVCKPGEWQKGVCVGSTYKQEVVRDYSDRIIRKPRNKDNN